jgi:lipopolysaccharide transport system permease protein
MNASGGAPNHREPLAAAAETRNQETRFRLVIEAGRTDAYYWADLWRYRELLYFLAWRDVLVRYKQTAFGILWALVRPALTALIFTVVFGTLAGLPSGDVPYALLVLAGLVPWQFFASAFAAASESLVLNRAILTKVYFPRLIFPVAAVVVSVVDLAIALGVLALVMLWYGFAPGPRVLALPAFVLLAAALATGAGIWAAAVNVTYRDFGQILPFLLQLGLYVSPIGFSRAILPERWQFVYAMNPMVGVIDGFRWALLGTEIYLPSLLASAVVAVALLIGGLWYFRRTERRFADVI